MNNPLSGMLRRDATDIAYEIKRLSEINCHNLVNLQELIKNSSMSNKYELLDVSVESFIPNLLVSMLYSTIDPNLVRTPIMEEYQHTISDVCTHLTLNPKNIVPICQIEQQLTEAINF